MRGITALLRPNRIAALPLGAMLLLLAAVPAALGVFGAIRSVGGNAFTTDTLGAPTGLSATGGASVTLTWTATADTYASGYNILRGTTNGGPYTQIAQVTPRTATSHIDSPGGGTYYYVLQSYYQNWNSANTAQVSAAVSANTGLLDCAANAAVTTGAGDNNGFQFTPANACADGSGYAEDTDSGTGTGTSCTGSGKDKHLFYNYGITVPGGSAINGIEVMLDAFADTTAGSPRLCAQLSWDGGITWVTAKTITSNLTTVETTYALGSSSDTWGRTWATSELTNANFRVRIIARGSDTTRDFRLDWVPVRITYTAP